MQRCPSIPQEKRSTGTGTETKTPNGIKEIKEITENRPRRIKLNEIKEMFPGIN